jgi:hypothetical protein
MDKSFPAHLTAQDEVFDRIGGNSLTEEEEIAAEANAKLSAGDTGDRRNPENTTTYEKIHATFGRKKILFFLKKCANFDASGQG